jgi:hypothetical protein
MRNPNVYASETWLLTLEEEEISKEHEDKALMEILERWRNKEVETVP